jgi:uroporphyrinogen-III synthase
MVGDDAARGLPAAAIGPITAETARSRGLNLVVQPASYTVEALCAAIHDYFTKKNPSE